MAGLAEEEEEEEEASRAPPHSGGGGGGGGSGGGGGGGGAPAPRMQRGMSQLFDGVPSATSSNNNSAAAPPPPPSTTANNTTTTPIKAKGRFINTGVSGGLEYTNTGPLSPASSVGAGGLVGSAEELESAQRKIRELEDENRALQEQLDQVKQSAEAYATSLEETMHAEIQKERERSAEEVKTLNTRMGQLAGTHQAHVDELMAEHSAETTLLRREADDLQQRLAAKSAELDELQANQEAFQEAFIEQMTLEFEESAAAASPTPVENKQKGDAVPLALLDSMLTEEDLKVVDQQDINLDDLDLEDTLRDDDQNTADLTALTASTAGAAAGARAAAPAPHTSGASKGAPAASDAPPPPALPVPQGGAVPAATAAAVGPPDDDDKFLAGVTETLDDSGPLPPAGEEQAAAPQAPAAGAAAETQQPPPPPPWQQIYDEKSGTYYWNNVSQESSWDFPPEGYVDFYGEGVSAEQSAANLAAAQAEREQAEQHEAAAAAAAGTDGAAGRADMPPAGSSEPASGQGSASRPMSAASSPRNSGAGPSGAFGYDEPPQMMMPGTNGGGGGGGGAAQAPAPAPAAPAAATPVQNAESADVVEALTRVVEALTAAGVAAKQKRQINEVNKGIAALAKIMAGGGSSLTEDFIVNLDAIKKAADGRA